MYEPQNCYEAYVLSVWECLTRGRNTKKKAEARESFYGMLRTQRGLVPQATTALFEYIENEYAKDLL